MPKSIGPRGELIFEVGTGDVICEVLPCEGQYCELAFGPAPAGQDHEPGEICFDARTRPDVRIRFPTRALLELYVSRLVQRVRQTRPPPTLKIPLTITEAP